MIANDGQQHATGWRPDIAAVEVPKMVAEQGLRGLAFFLAPIAAPPRKVDLTQYLAKVFGPEWFLNQGECGSCVAHFAALACDTLTAINTVKSGGKGPAPRTDPMTIYWGSRVEIGGGRVAGEGSVNVWAAEYLKRYGALPQQKYPSIDLTKYDPSVCCGPNSRRGVPDALEPIARQKPVKNYEMVRSFDEAVFAIANLYPVGVASSQGFRMELDANGFGTPWKDWNHSQLLAGYELDPVPCGYVVNSWGLCYSGGPVGWCRAVMKVHAKTLDKMLREGDSVALSNFSGFLPQKPDELDFSPLNF